MISRPIVAKLIFPNIKNLGLTNFFKSSSSLILVKFEREKQILNYASKILNFQFYFYSKHLIKFKEKKVQWSKNPFNDLSYNQKKHWSEINDFSSEFGDIKNIWELSRFNWIGNLALAYRITKHKKYLNHINLLLEDWMRSNPPYVGINWKCGQESSIRTINLILATEILFEINFKKDLIKLLKIHLNRIYPTYFYARSQDNNHGLSEAISIYLTANILWKNSGKNKFLKISKKGKSYIEDRVKNLILPDGSFSQYSVNYHRMVLDLLSITELLRARLKLKPFSDQFSSRVISAIKWFTLIIDPLTGRGPNFGGNDGTYLFNFDMKEYSDLRPTLSLATAIFKRESYDNFKSNHCLIELFDIKHKIKKTIKSENIYSKDGGLIKLVRKHGTAFLRVPKFKFRPSHSDVMHLDIWQNGINWIKDSGSYSYALNSIDLDKYSGTEGHSTVQFDKKNQMPRLRRFLFGDWINLDYVRFDRSRVFACAAYHNKLKHIHQRKILKINGGWKIIDTVNGKFKKCTIRWILNVGNWTLDQNILFTDGLRLEANSDLNMSFKLKEKGESIYYMEKSNTPCLEIDVEHPGVIETKLFFDK